jgi:RNA polymerase sigma factor (sigma-70 family)
MNRDELILSCENCVKNLVRKYNNGCNDEDLQSTGMIAVVECVDRCLSENMTNVDNIQARCNVWAKNRILNEIYKEKIKYSDDENALDVIEAPESLEPLILSVRLTLTPRQLEIFDLLLLGKTEEEIQDILQISERTYYYECEKIKEKIKN